MMRKQILTAAAFAGCAVSTMAAAVDIGDNTTVGGTAFLDFSHITQQQNGIDVPPTGTGFDVKRAYLIVNHKFNDIWSANLTTDAQFSSSTTAGSGGVTELFIKKLYLQAKLDEAFVVVAGSYDSTWVPFEENLYGYRWVEKTTTDRLGFATSADWGLHASGTINDGLFSYAAAIVNGGGYKNPTRTKDVDYEARVSVQPVKWLTFGAGYYNGHLGQVTAANDSFATNTASRLSLMGDAKYAGFHVGVEYFDARNFRTASATTGVVSGPGGVVVAATATGAVVSDKADGVSGWVSYEFTDRWSVFGRYDQSKLSKDVDPNLKDTYFHVGIGYKPSKGVDLALVYKNEKVTDGTWSISSADGNGSYTIGGTGVAGTGTTTDGKFDEIGIYSQFKF